MKKKGSRAASAYANPVAQALRNAQPISPKMLEDMRLREWSSLESFATGRATQIDARLMLELQCMCSCSIAMGIGIEAQEACDRASEVLTAIFKAHSEGGPLTMGPAQLATMRELQDLHDQQRALCLRGDYLKILGKADAMIEDRSQELDGGSSRTAAANTGFPGAA